MCECWNLETFQRIWTCHANRTVWTVKMRNKLLSAPMWMCKRYEHKKETIQKFILDALPRNSASIYNELPNANFSNPIRISWILFLVLHACTYMRGTFFSFLLTISLQFTVHMFALYSQQTNDTVHWCGMFQFARCCLCCNTRCAVHYVWFEAL